MSFSWCILNSIFLWEIQWKQSDFPDGSVVKNITGVCLVMQETREMQVQFLGLEDPLEEMAIHSSIFAWRIPQTEEPGGLQSKGSQRV